MKTRCLSVKKTTKNAASQAEQEILGFGKQYSHLEIIYFTKCLRTRAIIFFCIFF